MLRSLLWGSNDSDGDSFYEKKSAFLRFSRESHGELFVDIEIFANFLFFSFKRFLNVFLLFFYFGCSSKIEYSSNFLLGVGVCFVILIFLGGETMVILMLDNDSWISLVFYRCLTLVSVFSLSILFNMGNIVTAEFVGRR